MPMDRQKEPQVKNEQAEAEKVSLAQTREELESAKARLSGQAESLTLKENMAKHPYITLGVAFFAGVLLRGSGKAREEIATSVMHVISSEVMRAKKKE